jgi:CTP synthase
MPKYVFITGGVVSSIGKGIVSASLGTMLEARGYKIAMMKMDPYLNVDPGTMNPYEHGEVFVTDDGAETDLDLGHYERFTTAKLSQKSNITTGSVYNSVIQKERRGEYLGKTVQVIPHVTDEIKARIRSLTTESEKDTDIALVEIGGTVGDIEGLHFLEAIRQFKYDVPQSDCCYIHVTLVPYIDAAGELKTKPTQHSVRALRDIGIQPNVIVCRTGPHTLHEAERSKIAMFCDVTQDAIICGEDVSPLYAIPSNLQKQGLDKIVLKTLALEEGTCDMSHWDSVVARMAKTTKEVRIAAVGKYVGHDDAYKSINEAFVHAGIANDCEVKLEWVDSEQFEGEVAIEEALKDFDGILIGPGFGARGTEGKISTVTYARESKVPFMGICLGMQIAVIEIARSKLGLTKASSTEFDADTPDPVISLLSEQRGVVDMGGTMRLGAYSCHLKPGTFAHDAYGEDIIHERHRHRYEFNNDYLERLVNEGELVVSGTHKLGDHELVEIVEVKDHPWFCAGQFHPEFKSTPLEPQPMFVAFVKAALTEKAKK